MKTAFALLPEKGHLNPYIGPAQALQERGVDVVVAAPGDVSAQMERAGLPFHGDLIPPVAGERVTRGAELVALIQDPARLDRWIEELLLDNCDKQVEAVSAWYAREKPDAVVIDPLYYAAAIAAHLAKIPWASVSNSLNPVLPPQLDSALLRTVRRLSMRRQELFGRYGMKPRFGGCDVLSPFLTVAFATEAFTGKVDDVELVGPSFPLRLRGDEEPLRELPRDRPIYYASFGSQIYHWPQVFERLARHRDVHWVFSMGDLAASFSAPNCDAYAYAPQLAVLRKAAAFVSHGGANSVMESLAAGVPMLISPMCNDQFHQAHFIERAGAGRVVDVTASSIDLSVPPFPKSLHDSYQVDGARRCADLVASLC